MTTTSSDASTRHADRPAADLRPAADHVRERVWVRGTSLCRARDRLWRPPMLHALHERLRAAADQGDGDLAARWDAALTGADEGVVRLAAEALAVHLLIAGDIRADTKRAQIEATLALAPGAPALPAVVAAALEAGPTPTGVAFKRRRLSQIAFLLVAVAAWRATTPQERRTALRDPWAFRTWLHGQPADGGHAQREALLHLVHPGTFEPITSLRAKHRIVEALGQPDERTLGVDAALLAIRARLTPELGAGFSFGAPPLVHRWL